MPVPVPVPVPARVRVWAQPQVRVLGTAVRALVVAPPLHWRSTGHRLLLLLLLLLLHGGVTPLLLPALLVLRLQRRLRVEAMGGPLLDRHHRLHQLRLRQRRQRRLRLPRRGLRRRLPLQPRGPLALHRDAHL